LRRAGSARSKDLEKVVPASVFRSPEFGKDYGVTIAAGPLHGLLSRAVVIVGKTGEVLYNRACVPRSRNEDRTTKRRSRRCPLRFA
jgi:peroxiredoxin